MEAVMLLCDAAQEVNGKLYILGGGWSLIFVPDQPVPTTVAAKLSVPWDRTNQPMKLVCRLVDEDGEPVDLGSGEVRADGEFEAGRPAGIKPGTPIDVPLAIPFGFLPFPTGGYVFELEVDDEIIARAPFRVLAGPIKR